MEEIKGKIYSFNSDMAVLLGVEKAVLVNNICHWVQVNQANGTSFYDGRYWTYNSAEAYAKMFPFWTAKKIQRLLKDLEHDGHLLVGVYNKMKFDRTKWYSPSDDIVKIYNCNSQKSTFHCPKMGNDITQKKEMTLPKNGQPIPNIKPYINTDIKPNNKHIGPDGLCADYTSNPELLEALLDLFKMRKGMKKGVNTDRAVKLLLAKLDKLAKDDATKTAIVNQSIERGWLSVFPLKDEGGVQSDDDDGYDCYEKFRRATERAEASDHPWDL